MGLEENFIVSVSDAPDARELTTTEFEPFTVVNTGLSLTASDSKVNRMLLAAILLEAFFMRTFSVKSCPA